MPRDVPESPRQSKAKAKEAKKGRDSGPPTAAALAAKPSEDAKLLKKVSHVCLAINLQQQCLPAILRLRHLLSAHNSTLHTTTLCTQ